ncbi:MAG: DUF2179 domain-containing protein [Candidatus Binatia bacterium]
MDSTVLVTCLLIIGARIADVTLGTLRTVYVIQGRRGVSWALGFFEILIWIAAVSKVIQNLSYPAYALSYAFGFATGNYVGMTLEKWMATGRQVVRVFTREGKKIAAQLRSEGFRVTSFQGEGRDGPIDMVFVEIPRRKTTDITLFAREVDPKCYYIVEDVREASLGTLLLHQPTGWRAILKKK